MADVTVEYCGKQTVLPLIVVPGKTPSLIGRNWLKHIQLDWPKILQLHQQERSEKLDQLFKKYDGVFSTTLGCLKDFKVSIPINPSVQPRYFKARAVPYALKEKIDNELDRLVREGNYKPVEYSKWAAPIVPVTKDDGTKRICGDYKQTINLASPCDNYPIPNTQDLFATMEGGEKYTKLDLSHAYQQLELDDATQEYLTVNTQRGLYRPMRLQYGLHSATGIFQREMDNWLQHIPCTKVRVDDILISGKDDSDHLANLTAVLKIIDDSGLHLKRGKCTFMAEEVTYLGFKINKHGRAPLAERAEAIKGSST